MQHQLFFLAFLSCLIFIIILLVDVEAKNESSKIHPRLQDNNLTGTTANIVISFNNNDGSSSTAADELLQLELPTAKSQKNAAVQRLQDKADTTQSVLKKHLDSQSIPYESLWMSNELCIQNADYGLIKQLAEFQEVSAITEEEVYHLEPLHHQKEDKSSLISPTAETKNCNDTEWGILDIQAREALALLANTTCGNNSVIVAIIDTGVE
jgi:hypothetical protein